MQQMKASHCLTEMRSAVSKSGFFAHQRKRERPRTQQDNELSQAIEPSLWPAVRLTAVHASCMRCAEAGGAVAKIASPGSCAHAACAPGKNVALERKQRKAITNCRWRETGWPGSQNRIVPARSASRYYLHPDARGLALFFRASWTIAHDAVSVGTHRSPLPVR